MSVYVSIKSCHANVANIETRYTKMQMHLEKLFPFKNSISRHQTVGVKEPMPWGNIRNCLSIGGLQWPMVGQKLNIAYVLLLYTLQQKMIYPFHSLN
jgi:hypothetical protein